MDQTQEPTEDQAIEDAQEISTNAEDPDVAEEAEEIVDEAEAEAE